MAEMEAYAAEVNFPIIGPAAGYFNYTVARMLGARQVFELGSGYGYSTAWFARAVRENGGGTVHHVVWDDELSGKARGYIERLGYTDTVEFHVGEAVKTLAEVGGEYDLMFNDINKDGYPASIPVIKQHLRPGGALLIDNMVWSGKVLGSADQSAETNGIREATRLLTTDPDFITTLAPIRDGVMLAWRAR
ncbi:MAG: class I SAM-dependent methyltransferase [Armatimonadetes bacterium]|nr:class I SAM-dependent methyltransferase [Armatimonadota bacterium]MDE2206998.1 class I SAM-dependent methyltransferase [Armatimonadota bacterium]